MLQILSCGPSSLLFASSMQRWRPSTYNWLLEPYQLNSLQFAKKWRVREARLKHLVEHYNPLINLISSGRLDICFRVLLCDSDIIIYIVYDITDNEQPEDE